MGETLGREGTVVDVLETSGDVRVRFASGKAFLFNPRVRWFCLANARRCLLMPSLPTQINRFLIVPLADVRNHNRC